MSVTTVSDLTGRTGVAVDPHLADLEIPVISGPQCQGDLAIIPLAMVATRVHVRPGAVRVPVPASGVELLRGTAMGNPHMLVADPGTCTWTTAVQDEDDLAIGVIETSAPVYLLHREHGCTGVAPGSYVVRRQREQADEIRMVAD
ncbi:hypothetical protein [Acrocarpospora sp. B8E8]|uniref:hypothetical protein n=1 Tax=Acrocarpospora sp. B8E8 TaxID=3153572 RepID=UPI00325E7F60